MFLIYHAIYFYLTSMYLEDLRKVNQIPRVEHRPDRSAIEALLAMPLSVPVKVDVPL